MYREENRTLLQHLNQMEKLENLSQFVILLTRDFICAEILTLALFGLGFLRTSFYVPGETVISYFVVLFFAILVGTFFCSLSFRLYGETNIKYLVIQLFGEFGFVIFLGGYISSLDESRVIPWLMGATIVAVIANLVARGVRMIFKILRRKSISS